VKLTRQVLDQTGLFGVWGIPVYRAQDVSNNFLFW
jgi:hypothetical protein